MSFSAITFLLVPLAVSTPQPKPDLLAEAIRAPGFLSRDVKQVISGGHVLYVMPVAKGPDGRESLFYYFKSEGKLIVLTTSQYAHVQNELGDVRPAFSPSGIAVGFADDEGAVVSMRLHDSNHVQTEGIAIIRYRKRGTEPNTIIRAPKNPESKKWPWSKFASVGPKGSIRWNAVASSDTEIEWRKWRWERSQWIQETTLTLAKPFADSMAVHEPSLDHTMLRVHGAKANWILDFGRGNAHQANDLGFPERCHLMWMGNDRVVSEVSVEGIRTSSRIYDLKAMRFRPGPTDLILARTQDGTKWLVRKPDGKTEIRTAKK